MEELLAYLKTLPWPVLAFVAYTCVWFVSMMRNMGYRRLAKLVAANQLPTASEEAVSVVLLYEGEEELLRQRLPVFLGQQYSRFEVILACATPLSANTQSYLQGMRYAYPNLQIVPLPAHVLDISAYNLVLTLGMRAARHAWVLLSGISSMPAGEHWLATMASYIRKDKHVVVGVANTASARGFARHKYAFLRYWRQFLVLLWGQEHKHVLVSPQNLLLDKAFFLEKGGLAVGAGLRRGAVELAVNRYTNKGDVARCLCPEAFVITDLPKDSAQCGEFQLVEHDVWRRLRWSLWLDLCSLSHAVLTWAHSAFFVIALASLVLQPNPLWWLISAVVLMWLLHALSRDIFFHQSLRALHLPSMHLSLPFMLHLQPVWTLALRCRYRRFDKRNFRKQFV